MTVLLCRDAFVAKGTGGLGYLDGKVEKGGQQASIETRWAVDFDKAACDSWKRNRPEVMLLSPSSRSARGSPVPRGAITLTAQVHTYHMSVDDFLFMVEKWDALCKKYENYVASDDDSDSDDDEDEQERLAAPASPAAAAAAVGAGAAAAGGANEGEVMGRGLRKRVQVWRTVAWRCHISYNFVSAGIEGKQMLTFSAQIGRDALR
eukprot:SAG11_NODE_126_length_15729_cov_9.966859_13_plen_206_part_00